MPESSLTVSEATDPEQNARLQAAHAQSQRNLAWMVAHWSELLPRVRGRFLAVAGEEAVIADSDAEARALARAAHPDDQGMFVRHIRQRNRN